MIVCTRCQHKAKEIERQRQVIASQKKELRAFRARVKELEAALCEACEYGEVCKHFPARDVLAKA
ncbi:MAG: hypothetical protein ACE5HV_04200 [Acidobacteriota bacterium]